MKGTVKIWIFLLAVFAVAPSPVFADSLAQGDLLFGLDLVYAGTGTPQGTPPWLTATFQNQGPNSVLLTMVYSVGTSVSSEYVSSWFFNFDPTLDVVALNIKLQSGVEAPIISTGPNGMSAGNDLKFDIGFSFSPNMLTEGSTSIYLISSSIDSIDALFFDFQSTNTNTPPSANYYSAANILGTGGLNSWIAAATAQTPSPGPSPGPSPVPEPATVLLLGCGMVGLTFFGPKKLLG